MYLTKERLLKLYKDNELIIKPLLSNEQFGEISLDLRLGSDFLVSIQGREPFIDTTGDSYSRPISSFFQETKRLIGESFYLHPHQTVLCSSLEYLKLPNNIFLTLSSRSSYSRLGLSISAIVQPGYCGCIPIELTNNSNNPIKLLVGASILQARFFELSSDTNYFNTNRKYTCQVRPIASKISKDEEIDKLLNLFNKEKIT
jgi:dCTP deaminase